MLLSPVCAFLRMNSTFDAAKCICLDVMNAWFSCVLTCAGILQGLATEAKFNFLPLAQSFFARWIDERLITVSFWSSATEEYWLLSRTLHIAQAALVFCCVVFFVGLLFLLFYVRCCLNLLTFFSPSCLPTAMTFVARGCRAKKNQTGPTAL